MTRYFSVLITCIMLFSQDSFYRDWGFIGAGARATAMGGAFSSIADDATAIAWNPAGLTSLTSAEIGLVTRFSLGLSNTSFNDDRVEKFTTNTISSVQLNFASLVFPVNEQIVLGLSYRPIMDWEKTVNNNITVLGSDFKEHYEHTGGMNSFTLTAGYKFNEMLSLGANFNFLTTEYMRSYEYTDVDNPLNNEDSNVKQGFESTQSIDIGVLLRPVDFFSVGAMFQLGYSLDWDWVGKGTDGLTFAGVGTYDIPMFYSIGASIKATDAVTLSFDYRNQPWSETGYSYNNVEGPFGDLDLTSIHLGVEILEIGDEAVTAWRFGYFNKPYLEYDANGDQVDNTVITFGWGKTMERFSFDLSSQIEFIDFYSGGFGDRTKSGANFGLSGSFVFYLGN
ncbi:MAG: outer membrane protein transport protein [Calditrichaeota bacterium]|nr:outer membrane protein transport protein [Calditrichota bacterium]